MKRISLVFAAALTVSCLTAASHARSKRLEVPKIGEPAPAFSAADSTGKTRSLADEKGKFVVLEWTNHHCPYVAKHYDSGNMQELQRTYAAEGVVWFSVISIQGYSDSEQADKDLVSLKAAPTAVLFDPDQKLARLYGASTTPEMYIIDPEGVLIYQGAIDDIRSSKAEDVELATNYVSQALDEALAGKPVSEPMTRTYGCSIKYKEPPVRPKKKPRGKKKNHDKKNSHGKVLRDE